MRMKIAIVFGTRPEIIKLSPIILLLNKKKDDFFIIHTNQHFSLEMDKIFIKELKLPLPKYNLEVNNTKLHGEMVGKMIIKIEKILLQEKPDLLIVQGDTNSTLAGAVVASKLGIKLAHIEAGLRSYDRSMPEEINRLITDHLSDYLFAPTKKQKKFLLKEGIDEKKIFVVGNTIVDAIFQNLSLAKNLPFSQKYQKEKYFLLTLHRPSNVDDKNQLEKIILFLEKISQQFKTAFYFPIHPRTNANLNRFKIRLQGSCFKPMPPVGYLEMLALEKNAQAIFTDSGGLQEEACILKVPCITLRNSTERPETLEVKSNILVYNFNRNDEKKIEEIINCKRNWKNPFGFGKSAKNILKIINQI